MGKQHGGEKSKISTLFVICTKKQQQQTEIGQQILPQLRYARRNKNLCLKLSMKYNLFVIILP